jgi:subtilase family serine protease
MKLRLAFLASLAILPLLAAALPAPALNQPDLTIISVTSPNLDGGVVRVQVRNVGNADAAASMITVQLTGLQTGTTNIPLQSIKKGWTLIKDVPTGKLLSQVSYMVRVDRANVLAESNENNNTMSGQFGGKP